MLVAIPSLANVVLPRVPVIVPLNVIFPVTVKLLETVALFETVKSVLTFRLLSIVVIQVIKEVPTTYNLVEGLVIPSPKFPLYVSDIFGFVLS